MKLLLAFILSFALQLPMAAQNPHPDLLDQLWYVSEMNIDGTTYLAANYNVSPTLQFQGPSGSYVCFLSPPLEQCTLEIEFQEVPTQTFTIPDIGFACLQEGPCVDASSLCGQIHSLHFGFYESTFDLEVEYEIIDNSDGTLSMITTNANGDTAFYKDNTLATTDYVLGAVKLYPNPVSNQLFISGVTTEIERVSVYDISGKKILTIEQIDESIDVSSLISGMYFVEITIPNGSVLRKIIK